MSGGPTSVVGLVPVAEDIGHEVVLLDAEEVHGGLDGTGYPYNSAIFQLVQPGSKSRGSYKERCTSRPLEQKYPVAS